MTEENKDGHHSHLLSYIACKINTDSRYYTATLTEKPCEYRKFVNGHEVLSYSHGITIKRKPRSFWLAKKAFVYETDLVVRINKTARRDTGFAERLMMMTLNSDDIEDMIKQLTYGQIRLGLRGKKKFHSEDTGSLSHRYR